MRKLNVYISPLYIVAIFLIIYFGAFNVFCYYLVALLIHELSHYFMAKKLGYMLNSVSFMPYGAKLQGNTNYKKQSHELLVALSGPLCNIIIAFIIISIWWINPITYTYTKEFVNANLYLGIFNLLPLFPLDGGQALLSILSTNKKRIIYNFMRIVGILISVVYMALFISSAYRDINFSLFFISIFMFVTAIEPYTVNYVNATDNFNFKLVNLAEEKVYVVNIDTNLLQLSKYFSANYFVVFKFVDNKLRVMYTLNQTEILNLLSNGKYFIK